MSDDLDISGGGTVVSTEDLEHAVHQLGRLSSELGALASQLSSIEVPRAGGLWIEQSRVEIEAAVPTLAAAGWHAGELHLLVAIAGRGYFAVEKASAATVRALDGTVAQLAGTLLSGLAMSTGFLTSLVGGAWWGARASGGLAPIVGKPFEENGVPKGSPFLKQNNGVITNATTVTAIRRAAQALGPFMLGTRGMPGSTMTSSGSYEFGSGQLAQIGRTQGLLDETPVRLVETVRQPVAAAPQSYSDRLERVPYFEDESGPQVVIERYTADGEPDRFAVYVGGTVTFSPVTTTEPWDMTSNVMNATGELSGSVASVQAAMRAAGVDAESPVQFTGYSQGGGTVARLAASEMYNVQGITTFGGPTGQVRLPDAVPAVLVEHADDLVPALGGEQDNARAVLVRRDVFVGEELPHDYAVPAHHLEYYLETARLMDAAGSPQLERTLEKLDQFTVGATLESSTAYRFERGDD